MDEFVPKGRWWLTRELGFQRAAAFAYIGFCVTAHGRVFILSCLFFNYFTFLHSFFSFLFLLFAK